MQVILHKMRDERKNKHDKVVKTKQKKKVSQGWIKKKYVKAG